MHSSCLTALIDDSIVNVYRSPPIAKEIPWPVSPFVKMFGFRISSNPLV